MFILFLITGHSCKKSDTYLEELDKAIFSIKTTECYGTCPVYEFYLFEGGNAIFLGNKNVETTGRNFGQLSEDKMIWIKSQLSEIGYFDMSPNKTESLSDVWSIHLSASRDGSIKKMIYNSGSNSPMDEFLKKTQDLIFNLDWEKIK